MERAKYPHDVNPMSDIARAIEMLTERLGRIESQLPDIVACAASAASTSEKLLRAWGPGVVKSDSKKPGLSRDAMIVEERRDAMRAGESSYPIYASRKRPVSESSINTQQSNAPGRAATSVMKIRKVNDVAEKPRERETEVSKDEAQSIDDKDFSAGELSDVLMPIEPDGRRGLYMNCAIMTYDFWGTRNKNKSGGFGTISDRSDGLWQYEDVVCQRGNPPPKLFVVQDFKRDLFNQLGHLIQSAGPELCKDVLMMCCFGVSLYCQGRKKSMQLLNQDYSRNIPGNNCCDQKHPGGFVFSIAFRVEGTCSVSLEALRTVLSCLDQALNATLLLWIRNGRAGSEAGYGLGFMKSLRREILTSKLKIMDKDNPSIDDLIRLNVNKDGTNLLLAKFWETGRLRSPDRIELCVGPRRPTNPDVYWSHIRNHKALDAENILSHQANLHLKGVRITFYIEGGGRDNVPADTISDFTSALYLRGKTYDGAQQTSTRPFRTARPFDRGMATTRAYVQERAKLVLKDPEELQMIVDVTNAGSWPAMTPLSAASNMGGETGGEEVMFLVVRAYCREIVALNSPLTEEFFWGESNGALVPSCVMAREGALREGQLIRDRLETDFIASLRDVKPTSPPSHSYKKFKKDGAWLWRNLVRSPTSILSWDSKTHDIASRSGAMHLCKKNAFTKMTQLYLDSVIAISARNLVEQNLRYDQECSSERGSFAKRHGYMLYKTGPTRCELCMQEPPDHLYGTMTGRGHVICAQCKKSTEYLIAEVSTRDVAERVWELDVRVEQYRNHKRRVLKVTDPILAENGELSIDGRLFDVVVVKRSDKDVPPKKSYDLFSLDAMLHFKARPRTQFSYIH